MVTQKRISETEDLRYCHYYYCYYQSCLNP